MASHCKNENFVARCLSTQQSLCERSARLKHKPSLAEHRRSTRDHSRRSFPTPTASIGVMLEGVFLPFLVAWFYTMPLQAFLFPSFFWYSWGIIATAFAARQLFEWLQQTSRTAWKKLGWQMLGCDALCSLFVQLCLVTGKLVPALVKGGVKLSSELAHALFVRDGRKTDLSVILPRRSTPRRGSRSQSRPISVMPGTFPVESSDDEGQLADRESWTPPASSQSDAALPQEAPVSEQQSLPPLPATLGIAPAMGVLPRVFKKKLKGILKVRTVTKHENEALEETGARITETETKMLEKKATIDPAYQPLIGTPSPGGLGKLNPAAYGRAVREGRYPDPMKKIQPLRLSQPEQRREKPRSMFPFLDGTAVIKPFEDPRKKHSYVPALRPPTPGKQLQPLLTDDISNLWPEMHAYAEELREKERQRLANLAGLQTPAWLLEHIPMVQQLFRDADMVNKYPDWFPLLDAGDREHFLYLKKHGKDISEAATKAQLMLAEKKLSEFVWWSSLEACDREHLIVQGLQGNDLTQPIQIAARAHWRKEFAKQQWWTSVTSADQEQFIKRKADDEDITEVIKTAARAYWKKEFAKQQWWSTVTPAEQEQLIKRKADGEDITEAATKAAREHWQAVFSTFNWWTSVSANDREDLITRKVKGEKGLTDFVKRFEHDYWMAHYTKKWPFFSKLRPSDREYIVQLKMDQKKAEMGEAQKKIEAAVKMQTFDEDGFYTLGPSKKPKKKPEPEPAKKKDEVIKPELPPKSAPKKCMPKGGGAKGGVIGFTMG